MSGNLALCRWLLDRSPWLGSSPELQSAFGLFLSWCSREEDQYEACQLFIQGYGVEVDVSPRLATDRNIAEFWKSCSTARCVEVILRHQTHAFAAYTLTERMELACVEGLHRPYDASVFLAKLGQRSFDRCLAGATTSRGTTILHVVARHLALTRRSDDQKSWYALGLEVLRNDADATAVGAADGRHFIGQRATPFLTLLVSALTFWQANNDLSRAVLAIQLWAKMMADAGIDLLAYGRAEQATWAALGVVNWPTDCPLDTDPYRLGLGRLYPTSLVYAQHYRDWSVNVRRIVSVPQYKLSETPGTFSRNPYDTICWEPDSRESAAATWVHQQERLVLSKAFDVSTKTISSRQDLFASLLDCTQDDNGFVMYMDLRSRREGVLHRSRSSSQPPTLDWQRMDVDNRLRSKVHAWMSTCHSCPRTSAFEFNSTCSGPLLVGSADEGPRHCLQYVHTQPHPVLGRRYRGWATDSFIAEIRHCQEGQTQRYGSQRFSSWTKHTGTRDCPRGCGSVSVDKLHVPEDLRMYHPEKGRRY